jgi:hypothetical protein
MAAVQHANDAHPQSSRSARPAWSQPEPAQDAPPAPDLTERDWYVGIRGTPTGPIHGPEIRDHAAAGDIDGDSLVWREGMGEWRPLRTVPALLAIVEAARPAPAPAPAPAIILTPGPAAPVVPAPAASVPFALVQPKPATPTPAPAAAAPAPAPVAPAAPSAAAAVAPAPASEAPAPVHVMADPFAAPAPSTQPAKANGLHAGALDAPAAAPAAEAPAVPDAPPRAEPKRAEEPEPDLDAVLGRKRPPHPMAYAFIAAAAVFGGVAAWVLLSRPATQIVVVQAPAATAATATPSASVEPDRAQVDVGEVSTGAPQARAPRVGGAPRPKSTGATTAAPPSAPIDTSGFVNNVPGPKATGPSDSHAGGGGQLSQGEISAVVSQNQPLVRRKCWQPALEARPPNGATNARVNGSITIRASGSVESASASGSERDFPGLSSCIATRMRNWKFPPSGGTTTVNVPFVFAGQ